jgi:hypothetical protein
MKSNESSNVLLKEISMSSLSIMGGAWLGACPLYSNLHVVGIGILHYRHQVAGWFDLFSAIRSQTHQPSI